MQNAALTSVHPETPYLRPTLALSVWVNLLGDPGIQGLNIRFACDMSFLGSHDAPSPPANNNVSVVVACQAEASLIRAITRRL